MGTFLKSWLLLSLVLLAGCATTMELPPDFAQLLGRAEFRATTSDDAVLQVREVLDPTVKSEPKFWIDALRSDFVGQRGYVETGAGEVTDGDGALGQWVEFSGVLRGEKVGYLVAVWVRSGGLFGLGSARLRVVEFGGREAVYGARVEAVKKALATVRG